jgi:large subunit ribosomal protein L24
MKQEWSANWASSVQPRKQRKYRHNAPLHVRQSFVRANLSPDLRKRFGKRSMQLRKGDEIRVTRGTMKGKTGTVEKVDLRKSAIYVEELKVKKADGSEVPRRFDASNLMVTKLKLDDKKRQAILDRRESARATAASNGKKPEAKPAVKESERNPADHKEAVPAKKEAKPKAKPAAKKPTRAAARKK